MSCSITVARASWSSFLDLRQAAHCSRVLLLPPTIDYCTPPTIGHVSQQMTRGSVDACRLSLDPALVVCQECRVFLVFHRGVEGRLLSRHSVPSWHVFWRHVVLGGDRYLPVDLGMWLLKRQNSPEMPSLHTTHFLPIGCLDTFISGMSIFPIDRSQPIASHLDVVVGL